MSTSETSPSKLPRVDARRLRALGETAAGLEGAVGYLRMGQDNELEISPDPAGAICEVVDRGAAQQSVEPPPDFRVEVRIADAAFGEQVIRLDRDDQGVRYDAFWWHPSSVEKFMLPYYLRLIGTDGIWAMDDALTTGFANRTILGVAHTPRSEYAEVGAGGYRALGLNAEGKLSLVLPNDAPALLR